MVRLAVNVTPKSGVDQVVSNTGGELCVRVRCAPERGRANASACRVVAAFLGVPKSSVQVVRGDTARHKQLEVSGMSEEELVRALESAGMNG